MTKRKGPRFATASMLGSACADGRYASAGSAPAPMACAPATRRRLQEGFASEDTSAKPARASGSSGDAADASTSSAGQFAAREDMPELRPYARGSLAKAMEVASDAKRREAAVTTFNTRKYAKSALGPRVQKLETWRRVAEAAGFQNPFQLTAGLINEVAAVLAAADYRSVMSYVDLAKQEFVREHGVWNDELELARQDAKRAAKRGLGPTSKAAPFPMLKIPQLPMNSRPVTADGPIGGPMLHTIAGWWLLRELEAASLRRRDVTLNGEFATLELPISKSDPEGRGVSRTLACVCGKFGGEKVRQVSASAHSSVERILCPRCMIEMQLNVTAQICAEPDAPLFITRSGKHATKAAMIAEIAGAASKVGEQARTRSGAERWGGHAWRRGGVHMLASLGVPILELKRHARHSSAAIDLYLEGAPAPPLAVAGAVSGAVYELPSETAEGHGAIDWRTPPKYITSKGGVMHSVRRKLPSSTVCGWSWLGSAGATLPKEGEASRDLRRCAICAKRRGECEESSANSSDSASSVA